MQGQSQCTYNMSNTIINMKKEVFLITFKFIDSQRKHSSVSKKALLYPEEGDVSLKNSQRKRSGHK